MTLVSLFGLLLLALLLALAGGAANGLKIGADAGPL